MKEIDVVDAHSHIGFDNAWELPGQLDEYLEKAASLGIKESLLMSTPMPIIRFSNNDVIPIMLGFDGDDYYIVQGVEDSYGLRSTSVQNNPYFFANELLAHNIQLHDTSNIQIHFIPLIHPLLDTMEYLDYLVTHYQPVAFKIHGYSSILSPNEISDEFWNFIKSHDIPIIVHTDCDISEDDSSIDWFYRNENSPLNWITLFQQHSIRAYLTHGARLCRESCEVINDSDSFVVGLGPDGLLSMCGNRMYSKDDYLDTLFSMVDIDKICFDMDYPWNVSSYDNLEFDWNSLNRIQSLELPHHDLEKVLCKNAKKFFKL